MATITFSFLPSVPRDRAEALLAEMAGLPGVQKASFLMRKSGNAEVSRMAYLTLANHADEDALLARVQDLPEIEVASKPPQRRIT